MTMDARMKKGSYIGKSLEVLDSYSFVTPTKVISAVLYCTVLYCIELYCTVLYPLLYTCGLWNNTGFPLGPQGSDNNRRQ